MPLRLTPLEYLLARFNVLPTPLFDTPLGSGIAKALVTACELNLFDALEEEALPLAELAERVQCHPQGLRLLMQILISAGYVRQRKGRYKNTRLSQRWLTSSSPVSLAPYILHSPDIVAIWDHMPEVVRTYQQEMRMPYEEDAQDPIMQQLLARHYAGLASLATAMGGEIIGRIKLPAQSTRLLDVGGSHAAYSALLCHKYPALQATILDIQPGIEAGMRTAKQSHLEDRMRFVCGDIVQDDFSHLFQDPFDVALYFHVAHLLQPEQNQAILTQVASVLKPGGMLVFVDQVTDQKHHLNLASLMVQFMAITMTIVGGTCYEFPVIKQWLLQSNMEQVRQHHLFTPGATLITAIKKK